MARGCHLPSVRVPQSICTHTRHTSSFQKAYLAKWYYRKHYTGLVMVVKFVLFGR